MSGQVVALLKTGLALKVSQVKLAATSYVDDTKDHGKSVVVAYAVGAGFYAAAGAFFIAACLVGAGALFHYIEVAYGIYTAFAIIGGVLVLLALISIAIAAAKMKPPAAKYPGLMDRLRVAVTGKRPKSSLLPRDAVKVSAAATKPVSRRAADSRPLSDVNPIESARATAADVLRAPASLNTRASQGTPTATKAGAALAVTLLGWALARRISQTGRNEI